MFESLDIMISFGLVFLILSMILKYVMSIIKRAMKIKAKVIAEEVKAFIGENTSEYLIPYLDKKAKHLNFLEDIKKKRDGLGNKGLRQLNKKQLESVVNNLSEFLKNKPARVIKKELDLEISEDDIRKKIKEIKDHLESLKVKIEHNYDNTMQRISEIYETKLRKHTLVWGIVLAVFINADFFEIYTSLSKNDLAREQLAAKAEVISSQMKSLSAQIELKEKQGGDKLEALGKEAGENLSELTMNLDEAGLDLGWKWKKITALFSNGCLSSLFEIFQKMLGLLISGFLISFGAPFWHGFLKSFTGIRGALRTDVRGEKTTGTQQKA